MENWTEEAVFGNWNTDFRIDSTKITRMTSYAGICGGLK
jgi:hypothetical protein